MKVLAKQGHPHQEKSDLLIVPHIEGNKLGKIAADLDKRLGGWITQMMKDEEFEGKQGETVVIHAHDVLPSRRLVLVGVGKKKELTPDSIRRAAGTAIQYAKTVKVKKLTAVLSDIVGSVDPKEAASAFSEGAQLANYQFKKYKKKEEKEEKEKMKEIAELIVIDGTSSQVKKMQQAIQKTQSFVDATLFARDLVNEPAIHMKPSSLVAQAKQIAKQPGISLTVLNEAEMKKLNMGAILSVAAGSEEEAYFVHLKYTPRKKSKKKIALCGKGITFDSGGLSLKPTHYMDNMKMDMAGAANILAVFSQLNNLKPNVEVHGVFAATENMLSGKATRPGDVVTSYKGLTIEITNTDAEGRLILSDTLAWTEKTIKPDMMIDFATLTGAAILALGQDVAAMMGDKKVIEKYKNASEKAAEPIWELPLVEEYKSFLQSPIADCANSYKAMGPDTIVGGLFLQQFVENTPWVHIDIAGPAWIEKQVRSYVPTGASGFGVRSTIHFLMSF